jgi:hypothetical protein
MVKVRKYLHGEFLPLPLLDHGMPYLDPNWSWVVTPKDNDLPIALIVGSFAHGWLVLWRVLVVKPRPKNVAAHWFLEAMPKVFDNARESGCVGILTFLADDKLQEVKLARLLLRTGGKLLPFKGSVGFAPIAKEG